MKSFIALLAAGLLAVALAGVWDITSQPARDDAARQEGYEAGRINAPPEVCPFRDYTSQGAAWKRGWVEGRKAALGGGRREP